MKKNLFITAFAFLSFTTFVNAADVSTIEDLTAALADTSTTTINITANIVTDHKILIDRPITINGGGNTVSFDADSNGWAGNYVFHVYNVQGDGVAMSNIKLTAGDAGLLVNNSLVTLTGAIDVSGNEFGGIESSGASAILTVSGATLANTSEAYALPTLWEDALTGTTVAGFSGTVTQDVNTSQVQYYLSADSLTTVTTFARLQTLLANSAIARIGVKGAIGLTSQLTITRPVEFVGVGGDAKLFASVDFGNVNGSKHLVGVQEATGDVAFSELTLDSDGKAYGLHAYKVLGNTTFSNVTAKNSKGAGLTVNGSSVTASNFSTDGNTWGSVNVDPGSGVTTPSSFTLTGGTLSESNQIWSDGANVTATTTVSVNASGYTKYSVSGQPTTFQWLNNVTNKATITRGDVTTAYATIQAAVDGATTGETINVMSGAYTGDVNVTKSVTILGPNATVSGNGTRGTEAVITGRILVTASNVTIKGIKVTNPAWATAATIHGIQVWGGSSLLSTINLSNNVISNITNTASKGSYGIMIQGAVVNAEIDNNKIDGIHSVQWARGIEVTPTTATTTLPQNITVTNNTITDITSGSSDAYAFSSDAANATLITDASQITFHANSFVGGNVKNVDATSTLDASRNFWGASPDVNRILGSVSFSPWYADASMTTLSSTVTTSTTTTSVTFDTKTESTAGSVGVVIPAGITITGDSAWNGVFDLPTVTTTSSLPYESEGAWLSGVVAIEMGDASTPLTFSEAIKLTFAGQAGKLAGWTRNGVFTKITTVCDNATNPTNIGAGADCKITVGGDLVIFTKHATTFIAFTEVAIPYGGGGGVSASSVGSVSGGGQVLGVSTSTVTTTEAPVAIIVSTTTPTTTENVTGEVLGVSAYNFARNLGYGNVGDDVTELQKLLMADGYLKIKVATKWFGPLTKAALIKWQKVNDIPNTGFFGPISRGFLVK